MKRFAIVTGSALLLVWAASSALGGCGGDEEVTPDPGPDATVPENEGGTPGTDGSTSPTDGGGGGGEGGGDGGGTGSGSNPGKVTCGGTECNIGNDGGGGGGGGFGPYCCVRPDGGPTCETMQNSCFGGARLRCDEKSDCTDPGDDCCLSLGGGGGGGFNAGSSCQNNCFGTQVRLCKKATDCGDGGACNTITCGGRQYRACNKPAGCT